MRASLFRSQYLLTIVGILLLIGCTSPAVTPTATVEPSPIPDTPTPTATPTPTPTATHIPEPAPTLITTSPPTDAPTNLPTATPDVPLSAAGPWFIFYAGKEQYVYDLWAMNLDGTGLTRLPIDESERYRFHPDFDPQKGGLVAYVDGGLFDNPTLKLLHLPSGESETITPLTSEVTAMSLTPIPYEGGEISPTQIARAINSSPSWSPDGRSLAFVGAMNGISADIYLYSLDTGEITQITSGPTQVQGLLWSPDGKYILHLGIDCFGTGAGDNADAIWVSRTDGSGSIRLVDYPEDNIYDASLFGWMSNDLVLVSDYSAGAGYNNLRLINITTGAVETIWEYFFTAVAVERESGAILIASLPVAGHGSDSGVWLYRSGFPIQQITVKRADYYVQWLPETGVFYGKLVGGVDGKEGIVVVGPDGNNTTFVSAPEGISFRHIMEAPGGQLWAWYGSDGLYIGAPSQTPECVFDEEVDWLRWLPDGTGLFVATEDTIYYTPYPDINFQVIVSDLYIGYYGRFIP